MFKGVTFNKAPFTLLKIVSGINAKRVSYQSITYDPAHQLSLDFYPSALAGYKPCIIVIHGGSWAGGDSRQLPELNSELAKSGYHVASINYRLAPKNIYPSTTEDVQSALRFLRSRASHLFIDTNKFVLLGRSAGGQVAL
ncbi:MAG TPA: alpha/beta hydrolase, partial [Flavisolibacter sp.]|nr:alpha/beta hydrolase [Flavisolibacter sp.]